MIHFSNEFDELLKADKELHEEGSELGSKLFFCLLNHSYHCLHNIDSLPYVSLCPHFVDELTLVLTTTGDSECVIATHVALAEPEAYWNDPEL